MTPAHHLPAYWQLKNESSERQIVYHNCSIDDLNLVWLRCHRMLSRHPHQDKDHPFS
ncbi:MAG: hypothetical protein HGB15_08165 [Chlorobaculum sp.]|nr:hypothetical protein [Chlorobaculum sp.]